MKQLLDIERIELKYFIPYEIIPSIREFIMPYMELDPYSAIMENHDYTIRSIYFDSKQFDFYYEKLDGIKIRKKLRVRTYNEVDLNSHIFFEIKRKYENRIVKERTKVPYNLLDQICVHQKNPNFMTINENRTMERFLYNLKQRNLRPVLLVTYEREAFLGIMNSSVRLTFDKNVRTMLFPDLNDNFEENGSQFVTNGLCVLELKFDGFMPKWMRTLVSKFNLREQSISKYCLGIDIGQKQKM